MIKLWRYGFYLCMLIFTHATAAQALPEKFQPGLISNGGVFGFTLSPDGKTALWVESQGKREKLVIMESHLQGGQWSQPKVAPFSTDNGQWKDIDPIFSPDGQTVLFQSNRPVAANSSNPANLASKQELKKDFDIWAVKRNTKGWSEAFHMGDVINTQASESYASIAKNGNIYFMKDHESQAGNSDLFVAKLIDGKYQKPVNLGLPINTEQFRESNPFVSADEDYLIYFSSDTTGHGEVDLYISFNEKGRWTKPVNLGLPINSTFAEFCPFVHQGKLYFTRQKKEADRMIEDIYVIDFDPYSYKALVR